MLLGSHIVARRNLILQGHIRTGWLISLISQSRQLTGRAAEIIQQREEQHVATQQRRKEINRHMMEQTIKLKC
jgi:hypothetical protein